MSPNPPTQDLEQRLNALANANRVRSRRARLKRDLKAGRADLADILANVPDWARTMRVLDLLLATPKIGEVKALRTINSARVAASKTLGGMTPRQRRELLELTARYTANDVTLIARRRLDRQHDDWQKAA